MKITFDRLTISNFKNHDSLIINFSDVTNIAGKNGEGKTSIGEAITYLLYGIDMMGTKLDPTPIHQEEPEETKVEMLLSVDGKQTLLARTLKKGKAKYYINEVPEKATKYTQFVEELFDKNLFLSLFNPVYFSSQHWEDQRKQLLQFVSEPLNKEILAKLGKTDAGALEEPLKKMSLDDLEKVHREKFNTNDKKYDRASERVLTLKEQLNKFLDAADPEAKVEDLQKQINSLKEKRDGLDDERLKKMEANNKRTRLESQWEMLRRDILQVKSDIEAIDSEPIADACSTCGQPLDEESIQKVLENKKARIDNAKAKGRKYQADLKPLKAQLEALPPLEEIPHAEKSPAHELDTQIYSLRVKVEAVGRIDQLKGEIAEAEANKETIRTDRNASQKVVDAIKAFRTKRAELMVQKMDELFTTISVQLFKEQRNGDLKATFEIEMDGKPFSKLSTAEKIKAGLELIEVLSQQSGLVAPCFVDNAESIIRFAKPSGQLIVARVVDQDLTITKQEAVPSE
ncbi:AAA family ATPase [Fictibacillus fluitans]|uniref:Nuclease SbcCD subunit C n=1 Tax=Fictibacillus fluitans TaxID=3058422 RepID=A0ABT8HX43_9BACL|nr:AAA family ATPase [Fictibacillus sp. NE201]MDN4525359.1 AAA family ATPase [Fictibacillus sp. NE201]